MTDIPIFYIAHCVSAPTRAGILVNIADTKAWFKFLVETISDVAFSAPWLPYVEALDETIHRDRGLRDDHVMIDRHDGIVLTGPTLSSGMKGELDQFNTRRKLERSHLVVANRGIVNIVGFALPDADKPFAREKLEAYVRGEFARLL